MEDSIWTDLCKQPILKAPSGKYAQLVHDSTAQLHQSLQPILSALNLRAIGFTKCANFDAALRDAKVLQQLAPSSALGYIREADIYSERGQQLQVIDVCDRGMMMVDAKDTQYDVLKRAKTDAEQRQNTRIDFISQLPLDVVITSLIPMFMDGYLHWDKRCPYLYVSNLWRDRVFQCLDGSEFGTVFEVTDLSQVVRFARRIKILSVGEYTRGTWLGNLLRYNDFGSLQKLYVQDVSAHCVDYLVSSLMSISGTLTHCTIELEGDSMLPIGDILLNCSNLDSLEIAQTYAPSISTLPMTTWPKLRTLIIFTSRIGMITSDEIIAIGKRFPSLKKLQLSPCEDVESTRVVLEYYPWMNALRLDTFGSGFAITIDDDGPLFKEVGITRFNVALSVLENDPWKGVIDILRQHQQTLEFITFYANIPGQPEEIYNIEYGRLKKLHLSKSGWWIPHNAPMLEELKITWSSLTSESTMPDTTPLPPMLKKMELSLYPVFGDVDKAALEQYIQRFAHHSQLKELIVAFDYSNDVANVLHAILHLGQLERLRIECKGDWDSTQMERFFDGLSKGCPNLSSLGISSWKAPSTYAMNALKRLVHLEEFGFSIKNMDDDDGFWHGIQTFPQLKCIHVYAGNTKNMSRLRRLREQRPDLKIVVTKRVTFW
ncbi:hypothetical protein O0I10_006265 [Lichtheimia ornata]|uniref:F-box domain-containing protein n=1 Tax=Lichtheimia ornata TaxID=688661 RepID=A0AAD7XUY1_9FUNG|nr:uncharacterized protein O0I10_006265 [Lichtheimia ornata]KAJ8657994.1 hypothetical protein O0I10_006265 [Lichtheimia ornata]